MAGDNNSLFHRLNRLFKGNSQLRKKIKARDTSIITPDNVSSNGVALFQKSASNSFSAITSNAYNLSERLMRYQDFCEQEYTPELSCVTLDSIISTPNGDIELSKLLNEQNLKQDYTFQVYAYDEERKNIVIATAHHIRKTKSDKVLNITLGSGKVIKATKEHLFLTKQGKWVQAGDLRVGQLLIAQHKRMIYEYAIVNITSSEEIVDVYDLTVDQYHNFICNSVVAHNCALDIYAEEVCASDANGRTLHIYSENEKIKDILDDLFYNVLNIEFNLKPWVRNLCKFGDQFNFIDVSPEYGIMNVFPIPVNEIEREENYDRNDPYAVRFRWVSAANKVLQNWEVAHFRLLSNDSFLPYGSSILEPTRRLWRQLILAEDAMLVYRVVRAADRRAFYIDVGNLPADEIENYIEQQKRQLRSNQIIDPTSNRVDKRYNAFNAEEDFIIPVRGTDSATKIEPLAGGQNAAAIEDVKYLQQKMLSGLKIPIAWLGFTENLSSKATLSQLDVRFSRTTTAIQKMVISELSKIAVIHLFAHGFSNDDLTNFSLKMTNPSSIAEQQKLQLWRDRFEIVDAAPKDLLSKRWISKTILNMTDYDIRQNQKELDAESNIGNEDDFKIDTDVDSKTSLLGDKIFGAESEETPAEEAPETNSEESSSEEIVAGVDYDDEQLILSGDDGKNTSNGIPIKPRSRVITKDRQRQYVRHAKSGRADIGMSNNDEVIKADKVDTVFDTAFFKDAIKSMSITENIIPRTNLARSPDMIALLERMRQNGFGKSTNSFNKMSMLSESTNIDIQNEIDTTVIEIDINDFNIENFDRSDESL